MPTIGRRPGDRAQATPANAAQTIADQDRAEQEALTRQQHKRRLLAALGQGFTLTGVRLSNPKSDHAEGVVITFDKDEGAALVQAITEIVEARE